MSASLEGSGMIPQWESDRTPTESPTTTDLQKQAAEDEAFLVGCDADTETRRTFEELQKTRGFIDRTKRDIETMEVTRRELLDMIAHADDYKDEYFDVGTFCEKVSDVWADRKESDWSPSSRKTVRLFPNASSIMDQKDTSERLRRDRSLADRAQLELKHPRMYKRVVEDEQRRKVFNEAMQARNRERGGEATTTKQLLLSNGTISSPMMGARGGVPKHLLGSADGSAVLCIEGGRQQQQQLRPLSSAARGVVAEVVEEEGRLPSASYASLSPHATRQAALTTASSRPGSRAKVSTPSSNPTVDRRLPRIGNQAPRSNTLASSANNYETSAIRATLGSAFAVNPSTRTPEVERAMLRAQEMARQKREERLRLEEGDPDEAEDDAPELDATCRPDEEGSGDGVVATLADGSAEDDQPTEPFDRDGGPSRGGLRLAHVKHDNLSRLLQEQRSGMDAMDRKRKDEYEPVLGKYFEYHDTVQRKLESIANSGIMDDPDERGVGSRRTVTDMPAYDDHYL